MRILYLLLFPLILTAQTVAIPAGDGEALRQAMRAPTAPGTVYSLPAGVYNAGLNRMGADAGRLSGTAAAPVVFEGAGSGQTIIECPGVCYFSTNANVQWRKLTFRGGVNSDGLTSWRFDDVVFDDPARIGANTGGILLKSVSGGINAGPLFFTRVKFDPRADITDTALDFVGVQGVEIVDSVWERCGRGCLQAKGGSGRVTPYYIARNHIKDAGARGLFVGGSTDVGAFNPPIGEARAEFGAATIEDNVIEGGDACLSFSTTFGPVVARNNLCVGQRLFLGRFLRENGNAAVVALQGVTLEANVFAGYGGAEPLNASAAGVNLATIAWRGNVFDADPGFSKFPAGVILEGNTVEAFTIERVAGVATVPAALRARGLGPRTEPPTEPGGVQLTHIVVGPDSGARYFSSEAAAIAAMESSPDGCTLELYRLGPATVDVGAGQLVATLELVPLTWTAQRTAAALPCDCSAYGDLDSVSARACGCDALRAGGLNVWWTVPEMPACKEARNAD